MLECKSCYITSLPKIISFLLILVAHMVNRAPGIWLLHSVWVISPLLSLFMIPTSPFSVLECTKPSWTQEFALEKRFLKISPFPASPGDSGLSSYLVSSERHGWVVPVTLASIILSSQHFKLQLSFLFICLLVYPLPPPQLLRHLFFKSRAWLAFNLRVGPESSRTMPVIV